MSTEEAGRGHRRHRSRAEADQVAAEYEKGDGNEPQRWVAVEVGGHRACGSELAVLLSGGRRIEVKRGFDAGTLRQLGAVLEQA